MLGRARQNNYKKEEKEEDDDDDNDDEKRERDENRIVRYQLPQCLHIQYGSLFRIVCFEMEIN